MLFTLYWLQFVLGSFFKLQWVISYVAFDVKWRSSRILTLMGHTDQMLQLSRLFLDFGCQKQTCCSNILKIKVFFTPLVNNIQLIQSSKVRTPNPTNIISAQLNTVLQYIFPQILVCFCILKQKLCSFFDATTDTRRTFSKNKKSSDVHYNSVHLKF